MKKDIVKEEILKHVDTVLDDYKNITSQHSSNIREIPYIEIDRIVTRFRALIERFCNRNSPYFKQMKTVLLIKEQDSWNGPKISPLLGIIYAFRADVEADFLTNLEDIIHADLFSDFLEMASYLLEEGYKDAAAVIVGSTLESHLRLLCDRNSIDVNTESKGKTRPKKTTQLNSELRKVGIYTKLTQKSITSWLDLRNNAAHGNYDEYDAKEVKLMLMGVQDFIQRYPA